MVADDQDCPKERPSLPNDVKDQIAGTYFEAISHHQRLVDSDISTVKQLIGNIMCKYSIKYGQGGTVPPRPRRHPVNMYRVFP